MLIISYEAQSKPGKKTDDKDGTYVCIFDLAPKTCGGDARLLCFGLIASEFCILVDAISWNGVGLLTFKM